MLIKCCDFSIKRRTIAVQIRATGMQIAMRRLRICTSGAPIRIIVARTRTTVAPIRATSFGVVMNLHSHLL